MIKVGIVGTGGIAEWHASAFKDNKDSDVVAACDVNNDRLNEFCDKFNIDHRYNSVDELLEKSDVDAISNTTPDAFHKEISIKAIEKNKHIFCEKPLAENHADAQLMCEALKGRNLINMVNFSYRNSSGYQELCKMVQEGKIGNVIHMDANYNQSWLTSNYWGNWKEQDKWLWRLSTKHGSKGTLGDIGVHIFDFASRPIGKIKKLNSYLKTFHSKGEKIKDYVLDANDTFLSMVEFDNGAIGTVNATRFATGYSNRLELRIFGDKGAVKIEFDDPISEGNKFMYTKDIEREFNSKDDKIIWEEIKCPPSLTNFERFIESITNNNNHEPDFKRGAEIQKVLDSCYESSENGCWVEV